VKSTLSAKHEGESSRVVNAIMATRVLVSDEKQSMLQPMKADKQIF
jgi:hypothetical protein